uniref:SRPBCC domain-containing protein n=1 Tax=Roseihalotalea indica TaxID=2867963 RepID=A0AA49GIB2_9BACT|nr:SRPBCC domain-containing protein [Tunicatimonas sp. TK19036]
MNEHTIIVERVYDAPIEKVWQALTDKDQMKQWYFTLDSFEPKVGFEFSFRGQGHKGEQYVHLCKITEVIPNKKLQYSWQYENYEGYSTVTFELTEQGKKTHLTLTHEGLETFPQNNPDFAKGSFATGWNELITVSLSRFLEAG